MQGTSPELVHPTYRDVPLMGGQAAAAKVSAYVPPIYCIAVLALLYTPITISAVSRGVYSFVTDSQKGSSLTDIKRKNRAETQGNARAILQHRGGTRDCPAVIQVPVGTLVKSVVGTRRPTRERMGTPEFDLHGGGQVLPGTGVQYCGILDAPLHTELLA